MIPRWVDYDNLWLMYVGSAALIVILYAVKALVLALVLRPAWALLVFGGVIAICTPFTWALSPDWDNEHVYRIAIYVGCPIATFAVPCVSFFFDLAKRQAGQLGHWYWRIPLEVLVIPLWVHLWVFFEFLVLGWVWI